MLSCGPQESDATPRKSGRYNDVMFMRNRPGAPSPQWLANRRKGNHLPGPTRCRAKGRVGSSKASSGVRVPPAYHPNLIDRILYSLTSKPPSTSSPKSLGAHFTL